MKSLGEALADGRRALEAAGVDSPGGDARRLMAAALGLAPERPLPESDRRLGEEEEFFFFHYIALREARQPVAQILGGRHFYKHWFHVTPDTLDPRPETELLVELALKEPFDQVLDLGTGTGCILLSLLAERSEANGVGVDISPQALAVAQWNADELRLANRAWFTLSDWYSSVAGGFGLIVSNPPYIAAHELGDLAPEVRDWEPRLALTDGADGLAAIRAIAEGAGAHLASGGRLIVETGAGQGSAACEIFRAAGLHEIACHADLEGRQRVVSARRA